MAQFGWHRTWTVQAKEDLNAHQYFAVTCQDGKIANSGAEASGILINKPKNGEDASVGFVGEMPFQAGGAVAANGKMTVNTSGYFGAAGSGDFVVGFNGQTAVTSGSIGRGVFNFATKPYCVNSNAIV